MFTNLIALTCAFVGAFFHPLNSVLLPKSTDSFEFVVLGDNRPAGPGLSPVPVFRSILKDVARIGPAFVLSTGDLVYGNEEPLNLYNKECDEVSSLLKELPCPIFNAPGNHETAGRAEFQQEYEKRFGKTYGTFQFGKWQFVGISTDDSLSEGKLSAIQWDWLKTSLLSDGPKVVFLHRPIWARDGNDEAGKTVEEADKLAELLQQQYVKAVFTGHDHVFNHQVHQDIQQWITGGAGAPLDASPENGGYYHFLIVKVEGTTFEVTTIPANSLQVEQTSPSEWRVGNGSDVDIPLHHLVLNIAFQPKTVVATKLNKKKQSAAECAIKSIVAKGKGYDVTVDVVAPRHREVVLTFSPK